MAYPEMAPLVRLAGTDVALEILLEGRIFDAPEAKEKRLVTRVVPDERCRDRSPCRRRSASPTARRSSRAGTRSSRGAWPIRDRSPAPSCDECFDCFDTEDFRIGYARVSGQAEAGVRRTMSRRRIDATPTHTGTARRHARARARADHGRTDVRDDARRHGRRRRSRSRSCRAATTRAAIASRGSTASRRRS